jgi:O-antigen/teichoic acid export membrane protein
VYGSVYSVVAVPFIALFAMVIVRAMNVSINAVYLSLGNTRELRFFTMMRAVILLVLIYPAVQSYGLLGAALSALIAITTIYILQVVRVRGMIKLNLDSFWKSMLPSIPVSMLLIAAWALSRYVLQSTPMIAVVIGIGSLLGVYALLAFLIKTSRRLRIFSGLV